MQQIPLPLPHDEAMGADDFLVTASNHEAAAWVAKWPGWPAPGLILTGLSGSGKTHLLNLWLLRSKGLRVGKSLLLSEPPQHLARDHACVAIDDADQFAGNAAAEEAMFHLFNHLKSAQGSLLLTMSCGAGQAGFVLPDLRSRLLTLPAAALGAPDDELLAALFVKQFRDRQISLDDSLLQYLSIRAPRDAAGVRDLVDRLDRAALAEGRKISTSLARKVMEGEND